MWWWWCSKMKMKMNSNSWAEELKIPISENLSSPKNVSKRGFWDSSCHVHTAITIAILTIMALFVVVIPCLLTMDFTAYKPEIRLDSLIYCPTPTTTSTSNNDNLVIWDLRFGITNPNNRSRVCIDPFKVSIFFYNQTKLLKKMALTETCVGPRNHTSASAVADAFLLDPYDDLDRMSNGTIRFDLKIHGGFYYKYSNTYPQYQEIYGGELVCRDAKVVAFSTLSNSVWGWGCGSLVGDPVVCSYEYYRD